MQELQFALKIFNYFFTSVFILEAIMKIVALGFLRYIRDRWNQLDILIVILSIVGIVLEEMRTNVIPINPTIIRVMRVLRIARGLLSKYIEYNPFSLFLSLSHSIPSPSLSFSLTPPPQPPTSLSPLCEVTLCS